jgi:hypothetical protein
MRVAPINKVLDAIPTSPYRTFASCKGSIRLRLTWVETGQKASPHTRLRRSFAKSATFFEPERRKSRKSVLLYLHVSQRLNKMR